METHAHADHLSAAPYLMQQLGGRIAIGRQFSQTLNLKTLQSPFAWVFLWVALLLLLKAFD